MLTPLFLLEALENEPYGDIGWLCRPYLLEVVPVPVFPINLLQRNNNSNPSILWQQQSHTL